MTSPPGARRGWPADVSLALGAPIALYLAISLGFTSSYSDHLFRRSAFLAQYDHGVYRYRVLGREAALGVARVASALGIHVATLSVSQSPGHAHWSLLEGVTILNGLCFVATAAVLYWVTVRRTPWRAAYLAFLALAAASGYVITPYDDLRNLLMALAVLAALCWQRRSWPLVLILTGLAVATHEAAFVIVAALAALVVASSPRDPRRWSSDPLAAPAVAALVGSVGTYVVLRLALGGGGSIVEHVRGVGNLNESGGVALAIAVLGAWALASLAPPGGPARRRALWLLWTFSLPYLAVALIGGNLFEAPRLLMPIVLCHYLVAWRTEAPSVLSSAEQADVPTR